MRKTIRSIIASLVAFGVITATQSQESPQAGQASFVLLPPSEVPFMGTFFSLTLNQPPLPFNPFPELPVYALADGSLLYDDRSVDYNLLLAESSLVEIAPEEEQARRKAFGEDGGAQMMLLVGGAGQCPTNMPVHITNSICILDTSFGWTVTFDIQGGTNGLLYDVFAAANLAGNSITNSAWAWLERGPTCSTYQYTNQSPAVTFYVLGTPLDSDGDELTDAFERLVTKSDPNNTDTDGDGLSDGWEYWNRLNPLADDSAQSGSRANYTYDGAGRLRQMTGARNKGIAVDGEGNVTQAAQ